MNEALSILKELNAILPLADVIYDVRAREGKDWDGPKVKAWADALRRMDELLEKEQNT